MDRCNMKLALLAIAASAIFQCTAAARIHVVGDGLGWTIPPGGQIAYDTWALTRRFVVGDVLDFNFRYGPQDVAKVTEEAYLKCNSTNPISLQKNSPANFTLDVAGEYYFIGTLEEHCELGQKLAIIVSSPQPSPSQSPALDHRRRGPVNYAVLDGLGWIVPPDGELAYKGWAYWKTFLVGDALVFNFLDGTQDVAMVTKEAYEKCDTSKPLAVYYTSPAVIVVNSTADHFFTSTYPNHCFLGQKLAIHVTVESYSGTAVSPDSSPSPGSYHDGTIAYEPEAAPPLSNSASAINGYIITTFSILAMIFL